MADDAAMAKHILDSLGPLTGGPRGPQPDTTLLTDSQAAAQIIIEPRTMRLWRSKRGLPFLKLTGKVARIRQADLDKWLAQHRVAIVAR